MISPVNAAAAYANTASGVTGVGPRNATSFADVLEDTARSTIGGLKKGENLAALGTVGKADLTDVVQAVSNAEVTLQTVTAVRDKVLTAYQEIMRMPI